MDDYLRKLVDAPLADATKINLPLGRRTAPRAKKPEYTDDIDCQKLTSKQVGERKDKADAAKREALFNYYAGMKIVRLKRGYRISLSDSEFSAVGSLVSLGEAYLEGMSDEERDETERDMGRAAVIKVTGPGSWSLDEDRRA